MSHKHVKMWLIEQEVEDGHTTLASHFEEEVSKQMLCLDLSRAEAEEFVGRLYCLHYDILLESLTNKTILASSRMN